MLSEDALVGDGNSGDDGGGGGGDDEAAIEDAYSVLLRTIRTQLQRIEFKFLVCFRLFTCFLT